MPKSGHVPRGDRRVAGAAMTLPHLGQIGLLVLTLLLLVRPLGGYLVRVYAGERTPLHPILAPLERALYRLAGVDPAAGQTWRQYALALLLFNLAGAGLLYLSLRIQGGLPLAAAGLTGLSPDLAANTAVSFVTNTSWQSYAGEAALGDLAQMAGITVQSFMSAAVGLAVGFALIRGLARNTTGNIGNFWADLVRGTLYVLLPICILTTVFFVWQGVPQTLDGAIGVHTLDGAAQTIARGPVASQEGIKLLSGDGGGFFNANSAHPFENPTGLSNLVEILLIILLGAAMTNSLGRMVGDERQGWALFVAMALMFTVGAAVLDNGESAGNPAAIAVGSDPIGGNMEGKEVRFGILGSVLFAEASTASSDGAVNAMHDSFMPVSGVVLLGNMMVDEVIFGAPGSGLWGMVLFCLFAIFIASLLIGRTPEFVGKKIETHEMKMTVLALLAAPAVILGFSALACVVPAGLAGPGNAGPHGFSEILYAYTSAAATNGSAFAGLNANTPFYNLTLTVAMALGRFLVIVPVLSIAGSLATKRAAPRTDGTLPTNGAQFVLVLIFTIVIVGGLTFLPALSLGPVIENFALRAGEPF